MKYLLFLPLVFLLLASSGFVCNKAADLPLLTGRMVIYDGCGQAAVEVLSGQFDPSRVVASWKDADNDSVYHNVFRLTGVRGACGIGYYGVSNGNTFQFRMDPNPPQVVCYTCAIINIRALPPISNAVQDVKN